MVRVANALKKHAPRELEFVDDPKSADLQVLHVIGPDNAELLEASNYAVIQYCRTGGEASYISLWAGAQVVWSYYDLRSLCERFYFAPLGVDEIFTQSFDPEPRDIGIMTSGYVSHPAGEAIEEVAIASWMLGLDVVHLGPEKVEGMVVKLPTGWRAVENIADRTLAAYYRRSKWVSGLRHIEGFELPVLEGLMCGARPIVFDRPDMHEWYLGHARFVTEASGESLVKELLDVLTDEPEPVSMEEREMVAQRFSWNRIATGFWEQVMVHA